jgi:hypothetical protein
MERSTHSAVSTRITAGAPRVVPAHGDIEDAFIEQYEVPVETRSVSVSLDR